MTSIREAKSFDDAMAVLPIRNGARHFMTRHREEISEAQQLIWWSQEDTGRVLYVVELDRPIGYGLLRVVANYGMLTAAIVPELRGRGYGRLIFSFLMCEARIRGKTPWLEVRADNTDAFELYKSLGFGVLNEQEGVITMVHTKESSHDPATQ